MLVDLERNDLGRVSRYGSVRVNEFMAIEKYSHVMHIVSNVQGNCRTDMTRQTLFMRFSRGHHHGSAQSENDGNYRRA